MSLPMEREVILLLGEALPREVGLMLFFGDEETFFLTRFDWFFFGEDPPEELLKGDEAPFLDFLRGGLSLFRDFFDDLPCLFSVVGVFMSGVSAEGKNGNFHTPAACLAIN